MSQAWHPSRPLLATAQADGSVALHQWHPEAEHIEKLAFSDRFEGAATALCWSSHGTHLQFRDRDGHE